MKYLLVFCALVLNGCVMGEYSLSGHGADIPSDRLDVFRNSETTKIEEKMSFAPLVWFAADSVRKSGPQFESSGFAMGPLYLYQNVHHATYDENGKVIYHDHWWSCLWDIVAGSYTRRYVEDGKWVEDRHRHYLLGLFGHSVTKEGECLSLLFIPIPLG